MWGIPEQNSRWDGSNQAGAVSITIKREFEFFDDGYDDDKKDRWDARTIVVRTKWSSDLKR
jgi:hypothetical protein